MNNQMMLKIEAKMVFGRVLYYPLCPLGLGLASLLGKKTLSPEDLARLQSLGFLVSYKNGLEVTQQGEIK